MCGDVPPPICRPAAGPAVASPPPRSPLSALASAFPPRIHCCRPFTVRRHPPAATIDQAHRTASLLPQLVCACATVEEEGDADPRVLAPFVEAWEEEQDDGMDLRLCLRGEYGRCVAMVLDSAVLCESSAFSAVGGKEIEVYGVENMAALRDAVEFMFDADAPRWLARAGVSRAIAVLEFTVTQQGQQGNYKRKSNSFSPRA
ncbi:uncharacterized protein LOC100831895 isoform X3 [Brachypodium distachyon]|uniref:BTB domain-containing protein n=1 Tax=Brachypodium distachyon TaxID=15368 RepID=A0A0Q3KPW7_BRADI|nr:uncharacterized protein LOC100831895 isoform X3 [Brachypodium distachyon]KQK13153.1 hypothetical protein BRADI_1g08370v3 [Brachypodium distachyon]KQK13158.1 hypothetical protein BRADI_1g08370v3 [Brachypodium distachyon]|eukprot:XP_014752501.1 uncharacterized protein LOC100831895 isoform X3 [Brachypodium distachyon]